MVVQIDGKSVHDGKMTAKANPTGLTLESGNCLVSLAADEVEQIMAAALIKSGASLNDVTEAVRALYIKITKRQA